MQRKIGRVSLARLAGMSSSEAAMYSSSTYPTNRLVPMGLKPTGLRLVRRHQSSPAYAMIEDSQLGDPEEDFYSAEHDDRGMTYAAGMDDFDDLGEIEILEARETPAPRRGRTALTSRRQLRENQRTPQQVSRAQSGALRKREELPVDDLEAAPRATRRERREEPAPSAKPTASTPSDLTPEGLMQLQALAIRLMAFQAPAANAAPQEEALGWSEQEVVPGLRISVRQGTRWKAERLDTGQVLLTPATGTSSAGVGEVGVGALLRDTDGYAREIDDPKPQRGGRRW